ncbi:MAG: zinc transporter ZupT [Candidatus Nanoarchaeia archaeon]|nr:zinc transporter ZupT [Candidatus Nanoarchaeia archaeon]MDD5054146.1 zinc transporter ZupT [Candidatus Nanoarchaeia archaeon]MDD5499253.1 zinc transporter ZupT [Candidatus Nanoarchaeia archaeon]
MSSFLFPFILSLIAGLSTGIGSLIALFIKKFEQSYLAFALGLSAGVMIYISFIELLPESFEAIGNLLSLALFFAGMGLIGIIDKFIPEVQNPHHIPSPETNHNNKLLRTGVMTAIIMAVHNFPEGIAVFSSALIDARMGLLVAIAVAIHNIPEGIAVSMPIFYATKSKKKAFFYSFFSGLTEPLGALLAYFFLMPFLTPQLMSGILAFVAGIMIYISLDQLIPIAHKCKEQCKMNQQIVIIGAAIGMLIMALTMMIV